MKKKSVADFTARKLRDGNGPRRIPNTIDLSGWRFYGFIGMLVGTLGLVMYPIIIDPMLHPEKYREAHKRAQTEAFQAGALPGQLKKWDDPWEPKRK